jgi:hypothetical protein
LAQVGPPAKAIAAAQRTSVTLCLLNPVVTCLKSDATVIT